MPIGPWHAMVNPCSPTKDISIAKTEDGIRIKSILQTEVSYCKRPLWTFRRLKLNQEYQTVKNLNLHKNCEFARVEHDAK